jgi:hypothetical protein
MPQSCPSAASKLFRFAVRAAPNVGLPARILDQFAKRDLLARSFRAECVGDTLEIFVECAGLDDDAAAHIARLCQTMVGVATVTLTDCAAAARAA